MRRTALDMLCVDGERKCMLSTQTVVHTDSDTSIIVNSKYLPSNGMANDVGGIISASSKKNTVNDTRIEMHNVTCGVEFKVN